MGRTLTLDLSARLAALCRHLTQALPELAHIDPERVLFAVARSRAEGRHGLLARIAPLRFAGGVRELTRRRGPWRETYRMPTLSHGGREIHYLITVFVPRFLRLSFAEKLATVIHELYHISEACDGDIRRFPGRNFAHGSSRAGFDRIVGRLADTCLQSSPPPDLLAFLHLEESAWQDGALRLTGVRVAVPRAKLVARARV
ncbi:MAG: putative metallopeptidase [Trichloromonas sp.]|nr:putative metallopeptidase [Trichloromonas sp.]